MTSTLVLVYTAVPKKEEPKKPEPAEEEAEIVPDIAEVAQTAPPPKPVDNNAPKFVETYEEETILEKKTMTLRAKITGKAPLDVQWFR